MEKENYTINNKGNGTYYRVFMELTEEDCRKEMVDSMQRYIPLAIKIDGKLREFSFIELKKLVNEK